ncbi:hypothetical protein GGS26DRAFT_391348 [Hypomontagnella submonticulosa]|nr:hypothetical protein GGS26DRAFT_391348 [Hypomontagnella submonticulosa]
MGRPPAYIFIVRHGKRLDASDKHWHLSSPTPYDPPLTYGGWMQSKTVGARIASILHEREEEDRTAAASHEPDTTPIRQKKRRYKVVIHSSPFLRCVQSSVAIAAGLASTRPLPTPIERSPSPRSNQVSPLGSAARPHPTVSTHANTSHDSSNQNTFEKSVLRLDAFLGEWLSPDYFEHITPPPRSSLMLATAKAELLRRENYNDYPHFHTRHSPSASGQLWSASSNRGSPLASSVTPESDTHGLDSLSSLRGRLPRVRNDAPSHPDPKVGNKVLSPDPAWNTGYVSPVPSYALSTSEPIPRGYVAHARDACVDVDYQWDSSREHLGWGDGGVLPEEWAAMHQRFRKGFRRLVEWYSTTENPGEMVTKSASSPTTARFPQNENTPGALSVGDDEDTEIENVVVLVSHGAGCNALIGAITQQPVLIDVGMSSITMAERKPEFDGGIDTSVFEGLASSLDEPLITKPTTMSEIFELRLFANTEHLSTITPPSISRSSSSGGRNSTSRYTNGFSSTLKDINFGASLYGGPVPGSRSNSVNASLGSMRRGSPVMASVRQSLPNNTIAGGVTVGSNVSSFAPTQQNRPGSTGLWAPPQLDSAADKETETPSLLSLNRETNVTKDNGGSLSRPREQDVDSNGRPAPDSIRAAPPKSGSQSSHGEEHDKFDEHALPRLWSNASSGGLWGAPRPPGEAERIRDFSSTKRRWTVNER